jgi:muramoyltetrapeptide carboxypeptidase
VKNIGIAIAGPAGNAPDDAALARGIARLEAQGCIVHNYYESARKFQRFAGTDDDRLAQLNAAAADPDCQVVIALRGQYGISRILPRIDFRQMADSGKLFVGFSDMTAFHMALYQATGRISFAGPMMCADFSREEPDQYTLRQFWDCLRGPVHSVRGVAAGNPAVEVRGTLWGGNLAMVNHLIGRRSGRASMAASCSWKILRSIRTGSNACCCNCITPACCSSRKRSCWAIFPATAWRRTTMAMTSK